jgi:ABC-type transport system involved in cytochrome bd biosynthesis fused ATPase/permease subunit
MRADIIHVMRDGHIVESGSHDQLLAQNGLYAQSWTAQMHGDSSLRDRITQNSNPQEAEEHPVTP